jgi:2-haloacid dehalogenase
MRHVVRNQALAATDAGRSRARLQSRTMMKLTRRHLLGATAAAWLTQPAIHVRAANRLGLRAVAFDAFPIFDPRPVFALAEQLFPGRGAELSNAWRTRQFEYQWLRALAGRYADFWQATDDALTFSAQWLKLDLTPDKRGQLMNAYLQLKAWPDVAPALQALKDAGMRLAFVSNATRRILDAGIANARLEGVFDHVLSTDSIRTYKPDPRAYRMAIDALQLPREQVLFVPFAGWDAAGAKSFGYTTYWVNRLNLPVEQLGVLPDATASGMAELPAYVSASRA